jgi:hypothetical protein
MKYIVLSLSLILMFGCGIAQHGALTQAYNAMEKGDCNKVYRKLSDAEKYKEPTPELQAEISYLRSICLEKEEKYEEALALLFYVAKQFPNTEYGYRARIRIEKIKSLSREKQKGRNPPGKTESGI